eukprot:scaffold95827_cov25-Tisochrysis_lutea.AAC.4
MASTAPSSLTSATVRPTQVWANRVGGGVVVPTGREMRFWAEFELSAAAPKARESGRQVDVLDAEARDDRSAIDSQGERSGLDSRGDRPVLEAGDVPAAANSRAISDRSASRRFAKSARTAARAAASAAFCSTSSAASRAAPSLGIP